MEVAQPVGHDNGVVKSHVTFMIWRNTFEPELEINYICHPYQLPVEGAEPRNLNLADLAGIRTYVVRSEDRKAEGLFGDTLRVMLDLEEARWPEDRVATLDEIIATVRDCIFEMAARSGARWPYPKFLDIQVRGPERFASLGGISQIKGRTP
jgi:RNase P/RNase MRP subunit p29